MQVLCFSEWVFWHFVMLTDTLMLITSLWVSWVYVIPCDSCLRSELSMPQVPALNLTVVAFLEAEFFDIYIHIYMFVLQVFDMSLELFQCRMELLSTKWFYKQILIEFLFNVIFWYYALNVI